MTETRGYIYLAIKTEEKSFDLERFNKFLTINPTSFKRIFENGETPKCTIWQYASRDLINPIYADELDKIIADLIPHQNEFQHLKKAYPEVSIVLEIVIYLGDETPGLHLSREVVEFVNQIGGSIDCDIYNSKE